MVIRASVKAFSRQTHGIWLMALAIIFLVGTFIAHHRWEEYQAIDKQARKELGTKAQLASTHISGLIRNINLALDQIITETVRNGHCDQQLLRQLANQYPEFRSFTLFDAQGINRCDSLQSNVGLNRSIESYFRLIQTNPKDGMLAIEKPFVSKLSGMPVLVFYKTRTDSSRQLKMIAEVSIDLQYFDSMLESLRESSQAMFMIHSSGLLVSRVPQPDNFRLTDLSKSQAAYNAHRSSNQTISTHRIVTATDHLERFAALSDIALPNTNPKPSGSLIVGVSETVESVYADWNNKNWIAIAKWLTISSVVIALAWLVSLRQVKLQQEITQLSEALDEHAIVSIADKNGNIISVNNKFCEISGYTSHELIGRKHNIVNSGVLPTEFFSHMWKTISSGRVWHGLICNRAKDGRLYWVNSTIVPISNHKGRLDRFISIRNDVTDLILTEEKLHKAKEEADAANKAKSVFLSNMSHELRNPLNAIMGFSQLLQFEKLSPVIAEHVDHIHKAGRHLLTIVNEVLDLSRVEAGKAEIKMENIEIDRLIDNVMELAIPLATKQNIELIHQPASETLVVSADATRLSQVLLNLISNAIKYNKPQGKVLVYTQKLDRNRIRIKVSDTGLGLTADDQQKLFTPFTRLGQKNTEGTGIGLTISKQLVEIMNGKLGIESEVGVGSIFWIEFSAVLPQKEISAAPLPVSSQHGTDDIT